MYDFTDLIRQKVAEYNSRIGVQPPASFEQGGMQRMGIPAPGGPGMIPGPVTPGGGDNTLTPTQTGEYIFSVDAVMGLGMQNGAVSAGDALATGKHILDKKQMELKKEMGNPNPPRNAGIPAPGEGYAQGGAIYDPRRTQSDYVVPQVSQVGQLSAQDRGQHIAQIEFSAAQGGYRNADGSWSSAPPVAAPDRTSTDFRKRLGFAEGGMPTNDPRTSSGLPTFEGLGVPQKTAIGIPAAPQFQETWKAQQDRQNLANPPAPFQETWKDQQNRTTGLPVTGTLRPDVISYDSLHNAQQAGQRPGFAEGGMLDTPLTDAFMAPPVKDNPAPVGLPSTPPGVSPAPPVIPPATDAPTATPPSVQPAGIPASFGGPNTTQLKISAGDTATGPEKAVTLTNAGTAKYAGVKDARGVTANSPNNLPDLANSVRSIQETSKGNDINKGSIGIPIISMHGPLDPAAATAIRNRVDWSTGSLHNDPNYALQVENANKMNAVTMGLPKTEAQMLTGVQSNNTTWDQPREIQMGLAHNQFGAQENGLARESTEGIAKAKEDTAKLQIAAGIPLQQSEIAKNNALAATAGIGMKAGGVSEDGKQIFHSKEGMSYVQQGGVMVPYEGKVVKAVTPDTPTIVDAGLPDASGKRPGALAGIDQGMQQTIKGLTEYKLPLPTGAALRSPYWQSVLSRASLYDPSFSAEQYNTRLALKKDFTSGKSANNIRSLNTAVGHLDTLSQKLTALNNGPIPAWNTMTNSAATALGDERTKGANVAATAVESELAAAFKGTGATDQEIKEWRRNFDSSGSPKQQKEAIDTAIQLLGGRLNALQSQYEGGLGKPKDFKFLNSKSQAILKKLGADPDMLDPVASQPTAAQPPGQPANQPNPSLQDAVRLVAKDMRRPEFKNAAYQKELYDTLRQKGYSHEQILQIEKMAGGAK